MSNMDDITKAKYLANQCERIQSDVEADKIEIQMNSENGDRIILRYLDL